MGGGHWKALGSGDAGFEDGRPERKREVAVQAWTGLSFCPVGVYRTGIRSQHRLCVQPYMDGVEAVDVEQLRPKMEDRLPCQISAVPELLPSGTLLDNVGEVLEAGQRRHGRDDQDCASLCASRPSLDVQPLARSPSSRPLNRSNLQQSWEPK